MKSKESKIVKLNNEIINDENLLEEFEQWKKAEGIDDSKSLNDVGTAAESFITAVKNKNIPQLYNLHLELEKAVSDRSHLQGSIKQKHGVVAEKQEVHNRNAKAIKQGKKPTASLSDNGIDQTTDVVIDGKKYQFKFCKTPEKTYEALFKEKYDDVHKMAPKDQYDEIIKIAQNKMAEHLKAAQECKKNGDIEGYQKHQKLAKRNAKFIKMTEAASIGYKDAIAELKHPKLAKAIRVSGDIVESGINAALPAAGITMVVSGCTEFYQVMKGDKEWTQALIETGKATASSAATAFGVGAGGATISIASTKVAEKVTSKAAKDALENFAKGSAPTYIALAIIEASKSFYKYSKGELSESELALELGEKTVCTVVSGVVGALTSELTPIVSMALSTAAYMATSAMYKGVIDAIRWAKSAEQARKLIPQYEQCYQQMLATRLALENFLNEQTTLRKKVLDDALEKIDQATENQNLEMFINALNSIMIIYGDGVEFKNLESFDNFMLDKESTLIL